MLNSTQPSNLGLGNRSDYSPQEIIFTLLQAIGCESVHETVCDTEIGRIQGVQADVGNETISMFLVKDEKEFLSVLGLGEEVFHV